MEYKEGRCPYCNEVMQVPVEREKIICMFCGKEFSPKEEGAQQEKEAGQAVEPVDDSALFQELEAGVAGFFADMEKTIGGFHRTRYEDSFRQYCIAHSQCLKAINGLLGKTYTEETGEKIGALFVESAVSVRDREKGKIKKENAQLNLNMLMVTFVLPAILELENGQAKDLADTICRVWSAHFKNSGIKSASYESIKSGFRTKLCYITTAVCESLHKPEDCYELTLLKNYRDGYLLSVPGGEELVEHYYDIAPTIVTRIGKSEASKETYHMIWENYLKPCVRLIEEAKNEECRQIYTDMVTVLHKKYMEGGHE